jgi:proteic killer suppression protein
MIKSFGCKETEKIWNRVFSTRFPNDIQQKARRKLLMLDTAEALIDLQVPPSNRLEKLKGDRKGHFSIRINSQWRICFYFNNGEASKVEIVDYH